MKKRPLIFFGLSILVLLGGYFILPALKILTGYSAKNMCSCLFVGGMTEQQILNEDLGYGLFTLPDYEIDYDQKKVRSTVFGLKKQTAVYREDMGCALVHSIQEEQLKNLMIDRTRTIVDSLNTWPEQNDTIQVLNDAQKLKVNDALQWAFDEEEGKVKNTRAALIIYKGKLIAEQYAEGFDRSSRFQGWSMTKSITAVLYGILYDQGLIDLNASLEFLEQPRVSIKDLLQMSSGLEWDENYAWKSSVTTMLFESDTVGISAKNTSLTKEPGTFWEYSSGTTNILAYGLRNWFDNQTAYLEFPYDSLFGKLGMSSMIMEPDASGHFVGSSYSWATGRDWAKFGLMLINDGSWNGNQIVSKDWMDFVTTPAPASKSLYGGQFWLNAGGRYNTLPKDAYSCDGFNGQRIMVVPSKDLVIVRLGLTYNPGDFDFNEWFGIIMEALE